MGSEMCIRDRSYYLTTAGDFAALSPLYMLAFLALLLLPTLLLSGLVKYY